MRRSKLKVASIVLTASAALVATAVSVPSATAAPRRLSHPTALRTRVTGRLLPGAAGVGALTPAAVAPAALPSRADQIKVLTAALARWKADYPKYAGDTPGPQDVFDYGVGDLWKQGIDGAHTTVAVIEGWNFPEVGKYVASYDKALGLPNPQITTIYPDGPLPSKCPPGMVKLGSYGSCSAWAGELTLDVLSVHLIAPYAKIIISATPADSQITDDAASQVAPPEMMKAVEYITTRHLADVISISDGTGEITYSHGAAEILAQDPGELTAAAEGVPLLVATGDCGVVQNLAVANGQCEDVSSGPDTAAWDDSPWVTAVGGSIPDVNPQTGAKVGPDPLWVSQPYSSGAGYSDVYRRPAYQDGVERITGSPMRSVPDITMDGQDGTSEAAPLFNGILDLATQENGGRPVGPVNPVLYRDLGPRGAKAGIADVIGGTDNSLNSNGTVRVPGFTAVKGFDVASGWGTVYAPTFTRALVAATRAAHQDRAVRAQAAGDLARLVRSATVSPHTVDRSGLIYLQASGFLPGHPVVVAIGGRTIATLHADSLGYVDWTARPDGIGLRPGTQTLTLSSLLITERTSFRVG